MIWIWFSFSKTCYLTKTKETRLPYCLLIAGWRTDGFMLFPRALVQSETCTHTISLSLSLSHVYIYNQWSGRLGFNLRSRHTKDLVPDTSLLNTQQYKVVSRVKWGNSGNRVVPSPTPRCSSYWKGSLLVTLNYGCQLYFFTYIYTAMFLLICLISCFKHLNDKRETILGFFFCFIFQK